MTLQQRLRGRVPALLIGFFVSLLATADLPAQGQTTAPQLAKFTYSVHGDWAVEYFSRNPRGGSPLSCQVLKNFGTEVWLRIVFDGKDFSIDFSGAGTSALGKSFPVKYWVDDPQAARIATAHLVDADGLDTARITEPRGEPGSEDALANGKRLIITSGKEMWEYALAGSKPAMEDLFNCARNEPAARPVAQEKQLSQLGAWSIIARYENGRLHRCIAQQTSKSGMLRFAQFPDGKWNFSVPCAGQNINDGVEVLLGKTGSVIPVRTDLQACRSFTNPAPAFMLDEYRRGGTLTVVLGQTRLSWNLANAAQALNEAANCARQSPARSAATTAPAAVFPPPAVTRPPAAARPAPAAQPQSFAQRMGPGCPRLGQYKSPASTIKASVEFRNTSDRAVTVYWIDFKGNLIEYAPLADKKPVRFNTYVGHVWIGKNFDGKCYGVYVVKPGANRFVIR